MFCPKCGNADQTPETFCRRCGSYLPNFDELKAKETPPEVHFIANSVLNVMSAIVSLTLAITLYILFLGREDTPFVIYLTAGFLTAIFAWQAQIFWRNLKLKKQIILPKSAKNQTESKANETRELLNPADLSNVVPVDFAGKTTNKLKSKKSS